MNFKFAQRCGYATTGHEAGPFLHAFTGADGKETRETTHCGGLRVKRGGRWLILMESQKAKGAQVKDGAR